MDKKSVDWKKIEPKQSSLTREFFVVKTFETEFKIKEGILGNNEEIEEIKDGLPYDPVKATAVIDLWSFGTMLYFLCAKRSLFEVNVDVDLVDGDVMEKLYNWSDDRKNQVLNTSPIEDPLVKRLICRLLSKQPFARGTMDDLLNDPFFDKKSNEQMAIKIDAGFNEIDARVIIEPEVPKVDHPPLAIEDETTSETPEEKEESVEQPLIIRNQSPVSLIYPPSAIEDETTSEAPKKKESVEHQQIIRNQSPVSSIYLNEDEEGDIDKNQFDANERTTR